MSQISFKLLCLGDKRLFLKGWFQGYSESFPKYTGSKLKLQKTETCFCRQKSTDNSDINIFRSLENPCTFFLAIEKTWKRIFNTNGELSRNRTEKQIMPFKTTANWLFNDIWCYLVIGCFDWKIGLFQQTKGLIVSLTFNISLCKGIIFILKALCLQCNVLAIFWQRLPFSRVSNITLLDMSTLLGKDFL